MNLWQSNASKPTRELAVDVPAGKNLTCINIESTVVRPGLGLVGAVVKRRRGPSSSCGVVSARVPADLHRPDLAPRVPVTRGRPADDDIRVR